MKDSEFFKTWLRLRDITLLQSSKYLGISPSQVTRIIQGNARITKTIAYRMKIADKYIQLINQRPADVILLKYEFELWYSSLERIHRYSDAKTLPPHVFGYAVGIKER